MSLISFISQFLSLEKKAVDLTKFIVVEDCSESYSELEGYCLCFDKDRRGDFISYFTEKWGAAPEHFRQLYDNDPISVLSLPAMREGTKYTKSLVGYHGGVNETLVAYGLEPLTQPENDEDDFIIDFGLGGEHAEASVGEDEWKKVVEQDPKEVEDLAVKEVEDTVVEGPTVEETEVEEPTTVEEEDFIIESTVVTTEQAVENHSSIEDAVVTSENPVVEEASEEVAKEILDAVTAKETVEESVEENSAEATEPAEQPTEEVVEETAEETVAEPTVAEEEPSKEPIEEPAEPTVEEPVEPAEPVEEPVEEPSEEPTEKTVEELKQPSEEQSKVEPSSREEKLETQSEDKVVVLSREEQTKEQLKEQLEIMNKAMEILPAFQENFVSLMDKMFGDRVKHLTEKKEVSKELFDHSIEVLKSIGPYRVNKATIVSLTRLWKRGEVEVVYTMLSEMMDYFEEVKLDESL